MPRGRPKHQWTEQELLLVRSYPRSPVYAIAKTLGIGVKLVRDKLREFGIVTLRGPRPNARMIGECAASEQRSAATVGERSANT
jgi:hypothetical protein